MKALRAYLALRGRTLGRQLREVGWLRLTLLGPFVLMALARLLDAAGQHPYGPWAVPAGLLLVLGSAHRQRADLRFLAIAAPGFERWVAVEYALLAVPVALAVLGLKAGGAAVATVLLPPLAAWAGPGRVGRPTTRRARSLFRSEAFEWVSGMRATWGVPLWLGLLAGAAWQHSTPLGPGLALAAWLLVLIACYGTPEPVTMPALAGRSADAWLRRRLLLGLGYAALTAAPLLGLLAGTVAGVGGALAAGLAWLALLALVVLTKYAFYPNAMQIRFTQALVVAVALALPANPVYPPLMAVAAVGLVWQSRRRLRAVLGGQA